MSQLKYRQSFGWNGSLSLGCIVAVMLILCTSCNPNKPDQRLAILDQRLAILEEQAKVLMISEAQEGFRDLFKATINPDKTRLVQGVDLQMWFKEHPDSLDDVPDEIKESITNNRGVGLLIQGGDPDKTGGNQDVVYLRPSSISGIRYFARGWNPCGQATARKCKNCTGCSGESEPGGIIKTCVCTNGCTPNCRQCPRC